MIYTNNPRKPELLDVPDSEKQFTVFYNRVPNLAITSATPDTGYDMANLISEIYSEYVLWTGDNIALSCTYTAGVVPDTLILGNPFSNTLSINGGLLLLLHAVTRPVITGLIRPIRISLLFRYRPAICRAAKPGYLKYG
jgi:hypothetical protein